jgi:hypothetical protein
VRTFVGASSHCCQRSRRLTCSCSQNLLLLWLHTAKHEYCISCLCKVATLTTAATFVRLCCIAVWLD